MPGQGNTEGSGGSLACKQQGGSGRATCEGKAWEGLGTVSERRKNAGSWEREGGAGKRWQGVFLGMGSGGKE